MIVNEKEVLQALSIPAIPKKKWDGHSSFLRGVAITNLTDGNQALALATFDSEYDKEPRIKRVFSMIPFVSVGDIYVIPQYMDDDVEHMDLDESSKSTALDLLEQAKAIESNLVEEEEENNNGNEYYFDNIHNDEEARAFIKSYNKRKGIKGKLPKTHETIVLRLYVIWKEIKGDGNR